MGHPLAVAKTPIRARNSPLVGRSNAASVIQAVHLQTIRASWAHFAELQGQNPRKVLEFRLQQRRRAVSIGLVSLGSHAAPRPAAAKGDHAWRIVVRGLRAELACLAQVRGYPRDRHLQSPEVGCPAQI
jgi:hypothetical protein